MKRWFTILLALACSAASAFSQEAQQGRTDAETIVRHVEQQFAGINDYTVTLDVTVDLERLKAPPMRMTMYFKQPDKVHFDAGGFAMLPKQFAAMDFSRLRERYAVDTRVENDTANGHSCLMVTLLPRDDRTHLRRVSLLVDPARWTPERVRIPTLDGRTLTASLQHQQVEGRWLPALMVISFANAQSDTTVPNLMEQFAPGRTPPQRGGTVVIRYSGYKLNTGLSDDLFTQEEGKQAGK